MSPKASVPVKPPASRFATGLAGGLFMLLVAAGSHCGGDSAVVLDGTAVAGESGEAGSSTSLPIYFDFEEPVQ